MMAIDNENLEMVELLINHNVDTKDALLHAISEEFVEAVEVLLDHEDSKLQTGGKHVNDRHLDLHPRLRHSEFVRSFFLLVRSVLTAPPLYVRHLHHLLVLSLLITINLPFFLLSSG